MRLRKATRRINSRSVYHGNGGRFAQTEDLDQMAGGAGEFSGWGNLARTNSSRGCCQTVSWRSSEGDWSLLPQATKHSKIRTPYSARAKPRGKRFGFTERFHT